MLVSRDEEDQRKCLLIESPSTPKQLIEVLELNEAELGDGGDAAVTSRNRGVR